jgi:hypothetical protein
MRKQAARDEERRTLDLGKNKAPESSAEDQGERRQTEQENIPQQEDTSEKKRGIDGETTRKTRNHQT